MSRYVTFKEAGDLVSFDIDKIITIKVRLYNYKSNPIEIILKLPENVRFSIPKELLPSFDKNDPFASLERLYNTQRFPDKLEKIINE